MRTFQPSAAATLAVTIFLVAGARLCSALPCAHSQLIQCATSLRVLSDNQELGFAAKKEDLDLMCPDMNEGLRCIDDYTRRCMAPHQRSHFNKLYAGSSMVIQEICQEGPYQDEFLRHASCMWEVKHDYEECARDYQNKIQGLSSIMNNETSAGDAEIHVRKLCCSFQEYLRCSHAIVKDTCGEETAQFTKGFLDRMASSLIQVHCEQYPAGSRICDENVSVAPATSGSFPLLVLALLASLTTLRLST